MPSRPPPTVEITGGDWSDLAGAGVVLICARVTEKGGGATDRDDARGRLKLLATNASVYRDVVPGIVAATPDAVLVAVTDPPDPLADLTRTLALHDRVLSTGTTIDTLRFGVHVAAQLGVHPSAIEGLVVGEHGRGHAVVVGARRGHAARRRAQHARASPLGRRAPRAGRARRPLRKHHDHRGITIIEGNDASQFGIGVVGARIAEAVLGDERVVLPVAAYRERYGVTIGLPTVVGREGAVGALEPSMSDDERRAFERSVATIRDARAASTSDQAG